MEIEEDITGLNVGLTEVDENVDFLFDEQVIQDERLLNLETKSDGIISELHLIKDDLESMFLPFYFQVYFCLIFQTDEVLTKSVCVI